MSDEGTAEEVDPVQLSLSQEYFEIEEYHLDLIETYLLGSNIEYIQQESERYSENFDGSSYSLRDSLAHIRDILETSSFNSSIFYQVDNALDRIQQDFDNHSEIQESTFDQIHQWSTTWERVLSEELKRTTTVPIHSKGIFDSSRLVENPESLFSEQKWSQLDDRPRNDIIESCRNLAIGSSTSSVMMSLRAVEHCLRRWHESEKDEELAQAWGAVLDQLMREYTDDSKSDATLLDQLSDLPPVLSNLYYLKDKRNEVNHPDKSPDIDEAQRTLMVVVSTISDILDEIEPDESTGAITISLDGDYSDNEDLILDICKKVQKRSKEDGAPKGAIVELGHQYGLSRDEIESALTDIMMDGLAYQPDDDILKVI